MYAIVDIAGQQFKVEKDQQIFVHRLEGKEGSSINFDNVLLIDDNGKIKVGAPAIEGAQVKAKILTHDKADKVIVFKKKRRKGYRKRNGHRQYMTKIQIESIAASGAQKATAAKVETPKAEVKTTATAAEPKKAATAEKATATSTAKKPATKKAEPKATKAATSKKPAAKSTTAKKPAATKKSTAKKDDKK